MNKTSPALADKNLEAFAEIVRNKYAYLNGGIFLKDQERWTIFFDTYTYSDPTIGGAWRTPSPRSDQYACYVDPIVA